MAAQAAATVANDIATANRFIDPRADSAIADALAPTASIRPLAGYAVTARARLGFHYLVKVRFAGRSGDFVLQNRWSRNDDGQWRIIECDDLGVQSPWKKPNKPDTVAANA